MSDVDLHDGPVDSGSSRDKHLDTDDITRDVVELPSSSNDPSSNPIPNPIPANIDANPPVNNDSVSSLYDEDARLTSNTTNNGSGPALDSYETLDIPEDVLENEPEPDIDDETPLVLNEREIDIEPETDSISIDLNHPVNSQPQSISANLVHPSTSSGDLPDRSLLQNTLQMNFTSISKDQALRNLQVSHFPSSKSLGGPSSSNFLLESRALQVNQAFKSKDSKAQEVINNGTQSVQKTFNDIKSTVGGFGDMFGYKIDWEFWTNVVNDYQQVVTTNLDKLNLAITQGIPKEFRGIIWQIVSKAKNLQLEELYIHMKAEPLVHEKAIKRDLTRTLFFTSVEQVGKGEELFNVIKAYSLFDPDVGYTQGMIFIAVPLVMNMTDSECFSLLVTLMKEYNLRNLFCPDMRGLHLLLYQFDRLLELYAPKLYNHLVKQGVKLSMYALQWFLTFFAYKFPLDIVLRIYDVVITSGMELILKFALNLMIKNETNLMALKFDKLLEFLKDKLFNYYVNDEYIKLPVESVGSRRSSRTASVSRRFSLLGKRNTGMNSDESQYTGYYKLNELVLDSMEINVLPEDLIKYEVEFDTIYDEEMAKGEVIEQTKISNGKLRHDIKLLEQEYTSLNRDHVDIVQKMIDLKVILPEVQNENAELEAEIEMLQQDLNELELKIAEVKAKNQENGNGNDNEALPSSIEDNIHELLQINAKEAERYANLEDEYEGLLQEEKKLDQELEELKGKTKWLFGWR